MPARFSGTGQSVRPGPDNTTIIQSENYKVEYSFYELAEVYLITVFTLSKIPPKIVLEFLLDLESLGGQGVENFIEELLEGLEGKDPIRDEIAQTFNIPYESVTNEQRHAFKLMRDRFKI